MAERIWDSYLSLEYLGLEFLYKIRAVVAVLHSEVRRGYVKPACFFSEAVEQFHVRLWVGPKDVL